MKTKKATKKKRKNKRYIKKGICKKTGKQIWYDQIEKRHFFRSYKRKGYGEKMKQSAIALSKEGVGYRAIGRLLNISHTCAYNWITAHCESLEKPTLPTVSEGIEFDE